MFCETKLFYRVNRIYIAASEFIDVATKLTQLNIFFINFFKIIKKMFCFAKLFNRASDYLFSRRV